MTEAQAALIARWMAVGFVHGVMNTDNMTLSGETIDYGPCAFMDAYAPDAVFSSIDHTGRYAYGNQPGIAQWNLARLAETLLGQIDADEDRAVAQATDVLKGFAGRYEAHWLAAMRAKLGLAVPEDGDGALVLGLLRAMEGQGADWTLSFRRLSRAARGDAGAFRAQFADPQAADAWLAAAGRRGSRGKAGAPEARAEAMDQVNPLVIPRNHKVEEALAAAVAQGDAAPFENAACRDHRPVHRGAGARGLCPARARQFRALPDLLRHLSRVRQALPAGGVPTVSAAVSGTSRAENRQVQAPISGGSPLAAPGTRH